MAWFSLNLLRLLSKVWSDITLTNSKHIQFWQAPNTVVCSCNSRTPGCLDNCSQSHRIVSDHSQAYFHCRQPFFVCIQQCYGANAAFCRHPAIFEVTVIKICSWNQTLNCPIGIIYWHRTPPPLDITASVQLLSFIWMCAGKTCSQIEVVWIIERNCASHYSKIYVACIEAIWLIVT